MRCISLWQPWASAIFLGYKTIETRSWETKYRGELLIHAAKTFPASARRFAEVELAVGRGLERFPLGAILGVVELESIGATEDQDYFISALERRYGDFSWGRFGWQLTNIRPFKEPIGYSGRQGIFTVPDSVVSQAIKDLSHA